MNRRSANLLVMAVMLFILLCFVTFVVLRRHQLSLPDPYNNLYTTWSTLFLFAAFGLWIAGLVLVLVFRRSLILATWLIASPILILTTLFVVSFIVGMIMFVFP